MKCLLYFGKSVLKNNLLTTYYRVSAVVSELYLKTPDINGYTYTNFKAGTWAYV
jgi:hypothetical protein